MKIKTDWHQFKSFLADFGYFLHSERRGTILLFILSILFFLLPRRYPDFFFSHAPLDQALIQAAVDSIRVMESGYHPLEQDAKHAANQIPGSITWPSVPFDPNVADVETLLKLGIPEYLAKRIEKYRSRGGKFFKKEDLARIYGFPDSLYLRLAPWIRLESLVKPTKEVREPIKIRDTIAQVDINQANEAEWQVLKGIGPYYSRRIVRFRNSLGGFVNIDQVGETWKLPDSVFQAIRPFLKWSPFPRSLLVNSWPVDSLVKHPYINRKQASVLVNYRNHHGPFRDMEDLAKVGVFDSLDFRRLEPYMSF